MNTKTVMGAIFNLQNSYSLTFSLPTEEIFQIHGQNWPVAKLPVASGFPRGWKSFYNTLVYTIKYIPIYATNVMSL